MHRRVALSAVFRSQGAATPPRRVFSRVSGRALAASLATSLTLAFAVPAAAHAADQPSSPAASAESIEALRAEIAALRREYDERLADLEARLEACETAAPTAQPEGGSQAETTTLADLRAAALQAAGPAAAAPPPPPPTQAPTGRGNLNRLNPEISATGILLGNTGSARDEFDAQEFELDLQSSLDPFSRVRMTLAFSDEGVDVEEGYVLYNSLPGGLQLKAGKFRQRFGPLNQQHLHALPQSDYPLAYQLYFGDEGLAQTGVGLDWLLPKPWASANELVFEVTDGENERAFAGESFEDFSFLARLKNFWDLSSAAYLEWGLSGISGKTAQGGDSRVWGTDLTVHWQPPTRAKYRELTWRTELLRSERDDPGGIRREADGLYTYLEGLVAQNLYVGARFDLVEDPLNPDRELRAIAPYLTWWQSEFVRLRAEYSYVEENPGGHNDDRFTLQLTWAAGPHKHESY